MKKLLSLLLFVMLGASMYGQGVTTSSLSGIIEDSNGESLIGANVTAVHKPSGSFYGNSTNLEGIYRIQNLSLIHI